MLIVGFFLVAHAEYRESPLFMVQVKRVDDGDWAQLEELVVRPVSFHLVVRSKGSSLFCDDLSTTFLLLGQGTLSCQTFRSSLLFSVTLVGFDQFLASMRVWD